MKRGTPTAFAVAATCSEPAWLIAYVASSANCESGSFESSAMCTTASTPSKSSAVSSRMSLQSVHGRTFVAL